MQWDARLGAIGFKNRRSRASCLDCRPRGSSKMDLANIKDATEWFEVLQTSKRTQTAMMALAPGDRTVSRIPDACER